MFWLSDICIIKDTVDDFQVAIIVIGLIISSAPKIFGKHGITSTVVSTSSCLLNANNN